jgi:HD-like signal output (HDOD) protein
MNTDTTKTEYRFLKDIAGDLSRGEVTFPTFAAATLKIRNAINDPDISTDRLADALSQEPLVCLRLMKMANSVANRGSGRAISDVRSAVARLGMNAVHAVAMAAVMDQLRAMKDATLMHGLADNVWQHSLQVGARARVLTSKLAKGLSPDEALFTGLVHDVGYFYLLSRLPKYPELVNEPATVRRILATWHAPIGCTVLHGFNLPDGIPEAVSEHEDTTYDVPFGTYTDVLRAANHCSALTNPAVDAPQASYEFAPGIVEVLAEYQGEVDAIIAALH